MCSLYMYAPLNVFGHTHVCMHSHRNPQGLVGDLIKALKTIEREDVAVSLSAAIRKSKERKRPVTNGLF